MQVNVPGRKGADNGAAEFRVNILGFRNVMPWQKEAEIVTLEVEIDADEVVSALVQVETPRNEEEAKY